MGWMTRKECWARGWPVELRLGVLPASWLPSTVGAAVEEGPA